MKAIILLVVILAITCFTNAELVRRKRTLPGQNYQRTVYFGNGDSGVGFDLGVNNPGAGTGSEVFFNRVAKLGGNGGGYAFGRDRLELLGNNVGGSVEGRSSSGAGYGISGSADIERPNSNTGGAGTGNLFSDIQTAINNVKGSILQGFTSSLASLSASSSGSSSGGSSGNNYVSNVASDSVSTRGGNGYGYGRSSAGQSIQNSGVLASSYNRTFGSNNLLAQTSLRYIYG